VRGARSKKQHFGVFRYLLLMNKSAPMVNVVIDVICCIQGRRHGGGTGETPLLQVFLGLMQIR